MSDLVCDRRNAKIKALLKRAEENRGKPAMTDRWDTEAARLAKLAWQVAEGPATGTEVADLATTIAVALIGAYQAGKLDAEKIAIQCVYDSTFSHVQSLRSAIRG